MNIIQDAKIENNKEPVDFITVKGNKVPIFEGQTKEEAVQNFIEEKEKGGYTKVNGRYKSNRNVAAELSEKDNESSLAKKLNISREEAKELYPIEWHHTGKEFNKENFYPTNAYLDLQKNGEISQKSINQYNLNDSDIKNVKKSWSDFKKRQSVKKTDILSDFKEKYKDDKNLLSVLETVEKNKKKSESDYSPAGEIRRAVMSYRNGEYSKEQLEKVVDFYSTRAREERRKNMNSAHDQKDVDINGYVTYYDVPMTKAGVFPYLGRTISPELEPNRVYYVLRPIEELTRPETLKSLEAIPFVIDHTMIGDGFIPPENKGVEGTTLQNVKVKGDLITNDLTAYTDRCKQAIGNGKRDLSMGYRCRYDITHGKYNGQHYDAIQRDIIFNHIALVDEGRMGAECRVTDNAIVYDSLDINTKDFKNKETKKMAQITLDEDLKQELKEEIKKELLGEGGEVIETKKEEITDEAPKEQTPAVDEENGDEDKRKLIDEVGGILKGKVDEEEWRTIIGLIEKIAYKPSETGANDGCGKDEELPPAPEDEKKQEGVSMDEAIKYLAKRDELISDIKPVIGDNASYKSMTMEQVVKYACDKLDIKPSYNGLKGYLKGYNKNKNVYVTIAKDSAIYSLDETSSDFKEYLNGK